MKGSDTMNQEKIGRFIAENRKAKKLTQEGLAEKLGITNKSVSKWENGNCLPDSSLFKPLCKIYLGGDMPFWIEINPVTLNIINQFRIPGIYNSMQIDANKSEGLDYDCLTLLGTRVLGR